MLQTKLHLSPINLEHVFSFKLIDELNKNRYKPFSHIHQFNNNSIKAKRTISTAIEYAKEIIDPLSLLLMQSIQSPITRFNKITSSLTLKFRTSQFAIINNTRRYSTI